MTRYNWEAWSDIVDGTDIITNIVEFGLNDRDCETTDKFEATFERVLKRLMDQNGIRGSGNPKYKSLHAQACRKAAESIMPDDAEFESMAYNYINSGANDLTDEQLVELDAFLDKEVVEEPEESTPFDRYDLGSWTRD